MIADQGPTSIYSGAAYDPLGKLLVHGLNVEAQGRNPDSTYFEGDLTLRQDREPHHVRSERNL
jgi:hypothetical protein